MPFRGPPLALSITAADEEDEEDDASEVESDEDEAVVLMPPPHAAAQGGQGSSGSGSGNHKKQNLGLAANMAGLRVAESKGSYDDESPPGMKRGRAPPRPLERQGSYDVTPTMTLEVAGLHIKPEGLMEDSPSGAGRSARTLKTNIAYADMESIKQLGRGATSKVYLVRHRPTGVHYAVKELNVMADEDTRHMAVNELRIAHKHASHAEHLVRFIDAYYHAEKICIAMEYADAGSYADVIERSGGGVPTTPLGAITLQMLHGLQYLHREMHQVHRDLKPANVMLTCKGSAKLSDFGISKQLESSQAFAMTQVGTSAYMAPERLCGETYDWLSDVWSVGVITHEAIMAEHPFGGAKTFLGLHKAICISEAPPLPSDTPEEILEVVALCLRKEVGTNSASARPPVRTLLNCEWLKQVSRTDPQLIVQQYLMSGQAAGG